MYKKIKTFNVLLEEKILFQLKGPADFCKQVLIYDTYKISLRDIYKSGVFSESFGTEFIESPFIFQFGVV